MARSVVAHVKSREVGWGLVRTYPYKAGGRFKVPLYELVLSGEDDSGKAVSRTFKVIRFGVKQVSKDKRPRVVGLKDRQTWVLNRAGYMDGSWQLYGNFLIHDGADNPHKRAWGQVGCIEVTGTDAAGRDEWEVLESLVLSLSGEADAKSVSKAGLFSVKIDPLARRPPLKKFPPKIK